MYGETKRKCIWCGALTTGHVRCRACSSKLRKYVAGCRYIHKTSNMQRLLGFRNLLLDMKYNMPGATDLPRDLDYQLDRVSKYIAKEID